MACGDYNGEFWRHLADFNGTHPVDAVICPFTHSGGADMGMPLFALAVFGFLGLAFSARSNSIAPMVVVAIFSTPIFMVIIPGIAAKIVVLVVMGGVVVAGYAVYQRTQGAL